MLRSLLLLAGFTVPLSSVQAQIVTDAARAGAAQDSLLQAAQAVRQQVQAAAVRFEARTPRNGRRRQRVRGFASGHSARYTWEHKTLMRRNGTVVVRFTAWQNGRRVLWERRLNGKLTYVRLNTQPAYGAAPTAAAPINGTYLHGGYLRWNRSYYVLPDPNR